MYSELIVASHEALSSCTFRDFQDQNFTINTTNKNNLDFIYFRVVKKDRPHPNGPLRILSPSINSMSHNLSAWLIHHLFGHAYCQRILHMAKLGIYTGLPKSIPKISHPLHSYLISKVHYPAFPVTPFFHRTPWYRQSLPSRLQFFNKISCQKFPPTPPLMMPPPATSLDIPTN